MFLNGLFLAVSKSAVAKNGRIGKHKACRVEPILAHIYNLESEVIHIKWKIS